MGHGRQRPRGRESRTEWGHRTKEEFRVGQNLDCREARRSNKEPGPGKQGLSRTAQLRAGPCLGARLQEARREGSSHGSQLPSSPTTGSFFRGTKRLLWPINQRRSPGPVVEVGELGPQHSLQPHRSLAGEWGSSVLNPRKSETPPTLSTVGCPAEATGAKAAHTWSAAHSRC